MPGSQFSLAGLFGSTTDSLPEAQPNILTVCTGNICRSPLAETLLATHLFGLDLRVHSAGTQALVGHGMPPHAREIAEQEGVAAGLSQAHQARLLTESMMRDADLILTMTEEHSNHAVQLRPSRLHRTFTVREFARLAGSLTDAELHRAAGSAQAPRMRLSAVLQAVADQRGLAPRAVESEDVIDPYRQSPAVYRQAADQMLPGLGQVERVVRAALG